MLGISVISMTDLGSRSADNIEIMFFRTEETKQLLKYFEIKCQQTEVGEYVYINSLSELQLPSRVQTCIFHNDLYEELLQRPSEIYFPPWDTRTSLIYLNIVV